MINYYYLAMYTAMLNNSIIEDASFFIQSPHFLSKQQIKDCIKENENYTIEKVVLASVVEIGEELFKQLTENKDDRCFKIV